MDAYDGSGRGDGSYGMRMMLMLVPLKVGSGGRRGRMGVMVRVKVWLGRLGW